MVALKSKTSTWIFNLFPINVNDFHLASFSGACLCVLHAFEPRGLSAVGNFKIVRSLSNDNGDGNDNTHLHI